MVGRLMVVPPNGVKISQFYGATLVRRLCYFSE